MTSSASQTPAPTPPGDHMNGPDLVVVAIDGPSGSGKSSVARAVASRLRYGYLDPGGFLSRPRPPSNGGHISGSPEALPSLRSNPD